MDENPLVRPEAMRRSSIPLEHEGSMPLALAAGLAAAALGGGLWAAIALFGNMEIGWAAWGIGLMVGLAMARATPLRGSRLAMAAAGLAATGLLLGKLFVFFGSAGPLADELEANRDYLQGAIAWQMYEDRELSPATLDALDAWQASGDTLSDALWADMQAEAADRLERLSDAERDDVARVAAASVLQQMGPVNGVLGQLGAWDLLWFGLALATAYRIMKGGDEVAADEAEREVEEPARV